MGNHDQLSLCHAGVCSTSGNPSHRSRNLLELIGSLLRCRADHDPLLILARMDEQRSLQYVSIAFLMFPAVSLLYLATGKLELSIENEF